MNIYLLVREYERDRTSILGVYSDLNSAKLVIDGLVWEANEDDPVPSWSADPPDDPGEPSTFVIYELVLDHTVDIY